MKFYLSTLIFAAVLAGCSNYEPAELLPIEGKTYTGDNLVLYYNGEPMPNKSATLTQSGDKATAELFANFDLSQLSAFGLSGTIPAPGIFPGNPTTTINLEMKPAGEYWNFSGSGDTEAVSYAYKGYANDDKMALFLSDVKLKSPAITPAVWKPAPIKEENGVYTSLPFYINWQYDPIPGVDIDLSPYLQAMTTLPIIPVYNNTAYMSVSQALSLLLRTVAFSDDGNLIVSYISSVGGASHLAQSLPNRFMYLPVGPGKVKLYLNPTALFGMMLMAGSTGVPADDIKIIGNGLYPSGHVTETSPGVMEAIMKSEVAKKAAKSALSVILPQLADGLPLDFVTSDGQLDLCLDTQVAMAMMQQIVTPLLADSEVVKALEAYINGNTTLKPLLPSLQEALKLLPEAIERTNEFKIGLALIPAE